MKLDLTKLPVLEMIVGFLLLALAVTFIGAFAATERGSGDEDLVSTTATFVNGETPSPTPPDGGVVSISLEDNKFDPQELTVAIADTVSFAITNDGKAIHNMRIAGPDGDYETDDDAVSNPDVMRGGSAGTLEWTAADQPGEINFQCDFHPDQMKGTITVQ
jgi:plastocyanin